MSGSAVRQATKEQATQSAEKLLIKAGLAGAGLIVCSFEDSGPGITAVALEGLSHGFRTTKEAGMGMGLRISRSIIEAHGGQIRADNESSLGGARFSLELPVSGGPGTNS